MNLSPEESMFLQVSIYPEVSERLRNIDNILNSWRELVERVELGYEADKHSYENEVFSRELLELIMRNGPETLVGKIRNEITEYDERFLNATWGTKKPLFPSVDNENDWWLFRLPRKLPEGYFRDDVLHIFADDIRASGISYDT